LVSSPEGSTLSFKEKQEFNYLFFEASKQKIKENYPEAIKLYEKALELDPASHATYFELSRLYRVTGLKAKAIYYNEQALKINPNYHYWYIDHLMRMYAANGSIEKAAALGEIILDYEPHRRDVSAEVINFYVQLSEWSKGLKLVDKMIGLHGLNEETARQKEFLLLRMGKEKEAVQIMEELVESDPGNVQYLGLLAEVQARTKSYAEAEATFKKLLEIDPDNGPARFGLAAVYKETDQPEKSYKQLLLGFNDPAVRIQEKLRVIQSYLTHIQTDDKMYRQALELGGILMEVHPSEASPAVVLSDVYYAREEYDSSMVYLNLAIERQPSDFRVWNRLFSLLEDKKDYRGLVERGEEAMELFPTQPLVYMLIATGHYYLESYSDAVEYANIGLDYTINKDARLSLQTIKAESLSALGRVADAFQVYDDILKEEYDNALVLNNYAYLLSIQNERLDQALKMVKRALELEPENGSYLDTYGWVLYQLKQYQEALEPLKKAYALSPESTEVINHYAEVLFKNGQKEDALKLWKKSLSIKPDQPEIKQKINDMGS
jgi:tetratricopeptide (TPR) repeat protein